ncbi:glycosyltransferase family 4 protein [Luteibacter sp. PPL552]
MKILVVNNMAPFVWGGAEELAVHLARNLRVAGHESEILRVPFQWEPAQGIVSQMLLARTLELYNVDRVIALKFPAYLVRHPHKTLWLLHQYRQAYDLYDAGQTNIAADQEGDELRQLIKGADDETFREARAIYTNSDVTRKRLADYNGFDASVLLPPINDPESFENTSLGDYIFAGGRINDLKRQHLLVRALVHAPANVRLVIAGPADSTDVAVKLRQLAEDLGVMHRMHLDIRFLPREVYAGYVRGARAVAYLPFDEDSLGYVAMEAATAGKALISTTDSGGILGLVKHGLTGWVAEPDPSSLADAMAAATASPRLAEGYGASARDLWRSFNIDWPKTVEALLR